MSRTNFRERWRALNKKDRASVAEITAKLLDSNTSAAYIGQLATSFRDPSKKMAEKVARGMSEVTAIEFLPEHIFFPDRSIEITN